MKNIVILMIGLGLASANLYALDENQAATPQPSALAPSSTSDLFLKTNQTKPGVKTLADGLQYKILKKGSGKKPSISDTVVVHYEGKLTNGTEFDSSYKRGEPATFPVSGVIAGWTEALQLMPVGSTWELYIPASLAYGQEGAPPMIGPNETLIFKVNLIEIKNS